MTTQAKNIITVNIDLTKTVQEFLDEHDLKAADVAEVAEVFRNRLNAILNGTGVVEGENLICDTDRLTFQHLDYAVGLIDLEDIYKSLTNG